MPAYRKASIRELASDTYEVGGYVLQGTLQRGPEGQWLLDKTALDDWLNRHVGQEVVMLLIPWESEQVMETRICQVCGREFVGLECPTCREARIRLRGR
jgi:hypothetical protein